MRPWLDICQRWLSQQYQRTLGTGLPGDQAQVRWLSGHDLTDQVAKEEAQALVIEDMGIGLLLFLLPYDPAALNAQINQSLDLRSRLQREANYTGDALPGEQDDRDSTWRISLLWLVPEQNWDDWQSRIRQLRRDSAWVEEISIDALRVQGGAIAAALDAHGLPRLLLHTRALFAQSAAEAETWLSADAQVAAALGEFAQRFTTAPTRGFARRVEKLVLAYQTPECRQLAIDTRKFQRFSVRRFRNLAALEIAVNPACLTSAQAIMLYGPNGSGKSSFAEALSLAAFATSTRLEQFLEDKDIRGANAALYLKHYLMPFSTTDPPTFAWDNGEEQHFSLSADAEGRRRFEGVVLSQEDSLRFSELPREELATRVLQGYSNLADHLSAWMTREEKLSNDTKLIFTRKYNLSSAIKRSDTAYSRLAQGLLQEQLSRPAHPFLDWLSFVSRLAGEVGPRAAQLASAWSNKQSDAVAQLSELLAKLQANGSPSSAIVQAIRVHLDEYDMLANESVALQEALEGHTAELRAQLEQAIAQVDIWGNWLTGRAKPSSGAERVSSTLQAESEKIARERVAVLQNGKALKARLDLLEKSHLFLSAHWSAEHPDTCPVCDGNVANRQGIAAVVTLLQQETAASVQALRSRYAELQDQHKALDAKIQAAGAAICPLAADEQAQLRVWLALLLPQDALLEDWLIDVQRRLEITNDLRRLQLLPETPKPHDDAAYEANRLAMAFIALAQEADQVLEDPQAIAEVKKAFELRMEEVLTNHLPSTLGKVWQEITLTLTTAPWLLPAKPDLHIGQRGKRLSIQLAGSELFVRYVYNAAERHLLGLAWFFTYYLARRRHEEAWMLLDDPAQEMDQPSFRELLRFCETLLRLHSKAKTPFTLIAALHQQERALDAARATNARLYALGWQRTQQEASTMPSVQEIPLLAPGFHPLKPEKLFSRATTSPIS